MSRAYRWAFSNPVRKVYYNITVTSLAVAVALGIGMVELLQVTVGLRVLDLTKIGYLVVALFFATLGGLAHLLEGGPGRGTLDRVNPTRALSQAVE
jgi:high-affinity nickel-transport protein